jgi:hypothetical protein
MPFWRRSWGSWYEIVNVSATSSHHQRPRRSTPTKPETAAAGGTRWFLVSPPFTLTQEIGKHTVRAGKPFRDVYENDLPPSLHLSDGTTRERCCCQPTWSHLASLGWLHYSPPSHTAPDSAYPLDNFIHRLKVFCASSAPALMIIICAALVQPPFGLVTSTGQPFWNTTSYIQNTKNLAGCAVPPRVGPHMGENGSKSCVAPMPL